MRRITVTRYKQPCANLTLLNNYEESLNWQPAVSSQFSFILLPFILYLLVVCKLNINITTHLPILLFMSTIMNCWIGNLQLWTCQFDFPKWLWKIINWQLETGIQFFFHKINKNRIGTRLPVFSCQFTFSGSKFEKLKKTACTDRSSCYCLEKSNWQLVDCVNSGMN